MNVITNNVDVLNKIVEYYKDDCETLYNLTHTSTFFRQIIKDNNLLPSIWKIICHKNLLIDNKIKKHQIMYNDQINNINNKLSSLTNLIYRSNQDKEENDVYLKYINKNKEQLKIIHEKNSKLIKFANKKNSKIRFCKENMNKDIDMLYITKPYKNSISYIYIKELYINSNSMTIHTKTCPNCREDIHCKKAIEANEILTFIKFNIDVKFCNVCIHCDKNKILNKLKKIY